MTEFEEYFGGILDGKIVACDKMKRISEMLINDYQSPGEFHYDHSIATRHVDFMERFCKCPSGKLGTPLKLELFQKARFQAIFGFVDDNNLRRYQEVLIVEGRKNGKTTETAAAELDLLINDNEGAPQIYNVATRKEQAQLGFNAAWKMRNQSPMLKKHIRKRASDLYCPLNMGYIKAMASDTNGLDGLDVHGATIDELAAIKNRDLYDLVKQGMAAREQPLLFTITTNGFIRNGIFDAQYEYASKVLKGEVIDPRFLAFIYELDSLEEWDKEECWIKANPGLGPIKKLDKLRGYVEKAKNDPSYKPTVLVKDFNKPQTNEAAWLRYEELNNEAMITEHFDYCIGGCDAADTTDLSAAVALMAREGDPNIYVKCMFWIPQAVIDEMDRNGQRRERDNAPYRLWIEQGYMRTHPGNKVEKRVMLDWFKELKEKDDLYTSFLGHDPWHFSDEETRLYKAELGQNNVIPVRQGVVTLSQPMKDLAAEFKAHHVIYDNNPVLKWNLINTQVKTDVNGNIQPVKGNTQTNRIDGTAALLDAYVVFRDNYDRYIGLN